MEAFDDALSRAPDYIYAHNHKSDALKSRGELLAALSRNEEAAEAYAHAIAAYDEALSRAPDYIYGHFNKALAFLKWGESMRSFVQDEVTRGRWEAAQACAERVLALAPQLEQAEQLLALISEELGTLEAELSQEG